MNLKIINWNIGGAKFFELPSNPEWKNPGRINAVIASEQPKSREEFIWRLEQAFDELLSGEPHVVTLQEFVQYDEDGDFNNRKNLITEKFFSDEGYDFHFFMMVDTISHSAQGKWNKLKESDSVGSKKWEGNPYFAQGNAILLRKNLNLFPVWSIPKLNIDFKQYNSIKNNHNSTQSTTENSKILSATEIVYVEQGLYLGNRDTEPRAAIVTHIVASKDLDNSLSLRKPMDIFIVNLHLTTIMNEREGIPFIEEKATKIRLKQLDIIFNDIISRYNTWQQKDNYKLRDKPYPVNGEIETTERYKPIWILAGDFNFMPNSYEYEYIINQKFVDLISNENRKGTKSNKLGKDPIHTLDYVFAGPLYNSISPTQVRDMINTNEIKTSYRYKVSDHFPLNISIPIRIEEDE